MLIEHAMDIIHEGIDDYDMGKDPLIRPALETLLAMGYLVCKSPAIWIRRSLEDDLLKECDQTEPDARRVLLLDCKHVREAEGAKNDQV